MRKAWLAVAMVRRVVRAFILMVFGRVVDEGGSGVVVRASVRPEMRGLKDEPTLWLGWWIIYVLSVVSQA